MYSTIVQLVFLVLLNFQTVTVSLAQKGLIDAGTDYTGAKVCSSEQHPLLMKLADEHAEYMAKKEKSGHDNFDDRAEQIYKIPNLKEVFVSEICAESWARQKDETYYNLGKEMFKCWKSSPEHWDVASKKHKYFGCGMYKGKNGVWYACIIVCD